MNIVLCLGIITLNCSCMSNYTEQTLHSCAEKGDYEGIKELLELIPTADSIDAQRKKIVEDKNRSIDCFINYSHISNPAQQSATQSIYEDEHQIIIDSCIDLQAKLLKNKILKLYPECQEALLKIIESDMKYLERFGEITDPESLPILELPPLNSEIKDALKQIKYNYINEYEENSGETALLKAVKTRESTNRINSIINLLREGADPNNGCRKTNQTILHWESFLGHLYSVKSLIEKYGANMYIRANSCDSEEKPYNLRPFEQACETPQPSIIEYFLDKGVNPHNPHNTYDPDLALHLLLGKLCSDYNYLEENKRPITLSLIKKLIERYEKKPYQAIYGLLGILEVNASAKEDNVQLTPKSELPINKDTISLYRPLFEPNKTTKSLCLKFFKNEPLQLGITIFKETNRIKVSMIDKNNKNTMTQKQFYYNGSNEKEKNLEAQPISKFLTQKNFCTLSPQEARITLHEKLALCFKQNNWNTE